MSTRDWNVAKAFGMSSHDVAGRIGMAVNEHGTPVTVMVCSSCSSLFNVTGDVSNETWGTGCLADECDSYDVNRDAGLMLDIEPWRIERGDT